jgi:hypothetical protein
MAKDLGATDFDRMIRVAKNSHDPILCKLGQKWKIIANGYIDLYPKFANTPDFFVDHDPEQDRDIDRD